MSARSIGSGTISLGLVTIPVKLFTATRPQGVSFNQLHREHDGKPCLSRVNQILVCKAHGETPVTIEWADTIKGFEHTVGQYVTFTDAELKAIEASRPSALELLEFVPADTVDFISIEKTYYLGPDKGGDDGYALLADTMSAAELIGVGRFANRGKDTLVLLRPYRDGLVLHEAFYANEVLPFDEVPKGKPRELRAVEREAARQLVTMLASDAFDPSKYHDTWAERVKQLVEQKVAGEQIVIPAVQTKNVVDLVEALKQSVAAAQNDVAAARTRARAEVRPRGPKKAAPRKSESTKKRKSAD